MRAISRFPVAASVFALLAVVACSSSESPSASDGAGGSAPVAECNVDPWTCPGGQTCWPSATSTQTSVHFQCQTSTKGAGKGAACQALVGMPTCDDGHACFASVQSGSANGTCLPFCDTTNPAHACSAGETCRVVSFDGTLKGGFHLCVPDGAGGAGGGAGAGGAGGGGAGSAGAAGIGGAAGSAGSGGAGAPGAAGTAGSS